MSQFVNEKGERLLLVHGGVGGGRYCFLNTVAGTVTPVNDNVLPYVLGASKSDKNSNILCQQNCDVSACGSVAGNIIDRPDVSSLHRSQTSASNSGDVCEQSSQSTAVDRSSSQSGVTENGDVQIQNQSSSQNADTFTSDVSEDGNTDGHSTPVKEERQKIWTGKKNRQQKQLDDDATIMFINLVKKHWSALNDKHTAKNDVWKSILKEMESKYQIDAENQVEKLRLKWRGLWNGYKEYVKNTQQTGSSADTLLDTPPFFDEIEEILSSCKSVHPDYVSDTLCPTDQQKWSLDSFKSVKNKALKRTATVTQSSTTLENTDSATPSESATPGTLTQDSDTETTEDRSVTGNKSGPKRQSRHEQLVSLLLDQAEERRKEREEIRQERKKLEEEKEKQRVKRHAEKLAVASSLVETLRSLASTSSANKKRRKHDSDTD